MKQFYFSALAAFFFCVSIYAQQTNPLEEILLSQNQDIIKGIASASAVSDTADFILFAQRTHLDSTVFTYLDANNREGLVLVADSANNWVNFSIKADVLNANGFVIERIESLYENNSCCLLDSRRTIQYNNENVVTYQLDENYIDGAWVNDYRWIYEFDDQSRPTFRSREFWEEGAWEFESQQTNVYDEMDNLIFKENLTSDLIYGSRLEWEYNDDNQLISVQSLTLLSDNWFLYNTTTLTYNDDGQLINSAIVYENEILNTSSQTTYEYDSLGNETYQLIETIVDGTPSNSEQLFKVYDEQRNITEELSKSWYGDQWNDSYLTTRTFNEAGQILFQSNKYSSFDTWINDSQTTRTYNNNGILTSLESFNGWDGMAWLNGSRFYVDIIDAVDSNGDTFINSFYFDLYSLTEGWVNNFYEINYWDVTFLGIEDALLTHSPLNIYPNPTQGTFQLAVDDVFKNNGILEVFNLNGQLILRKNLLSSPQISVDLREVSKGLYVVKLTNGVQQATSLLQVK